MCVCVCVCTHMCVGGCACVGSTGRARISTPQLEQPSFSILVLGLHKRICPKCSILYKYTKIENHQTSLGSTTFSLSQSKLDNIRSHGDEVLTHGLLIKSVISSFRQAFPLCQAWLCTLERPSHRIPTSTLSSSPLYKGTSR